MFCFCFCFFWPNLTSQRFYFASPQTALHIFLFLKDANISQKKQWNKRYDKTKLDSAKWFCSFQSPFSVMQNITNILLLLMLNFSTDAVK